MDKPIIHLERLTKHYGNHTAVLNLNLSIDKGEIFGLLGPNGAGKTTTILMMLGLTEPSAGTAFVCGYNSARSPLQVKRRVGYMPDDIGFYDDQTAYENLLFTAQLNRIPKQEANKRAAALLESVGLAHAANNKVNTFSRGMRQRLGLADVLIKNPEVIILDEPTLGIDPEGVRELLLLISTLSRKEGLTVLLSSHHLHQVQQICDRVGLFVNGELIACGDLDTLNRQLEPEETWTINAEIASWSDALQTSIEQLEEVMEIKREETERNSLLIKVRCRSNITSSLAKAILDTGTPLHGIQLRQYGLDDIYHRYFEGGEPHDS